MALHEHPAPYLGRNDAELARRLLALRGWALWCLGPAAAPAAPLTVTWRVSARGAIMIGGLADPARPEGGNPRARSQARRWRRGRTRRNAAIPYRLAGPRPRPPGRCPGRVRRSPAYGTGQLRQALDRFVFLLGGSDSEPCSAAHRTKPHGREPSPAEARSCCRVLLSENSPAGPVTSCAMTSRIGHVRSRPLFLTFTFATLTCAILAGCTGASTSNTNRTVTSSSAQSPPSSPHVTGPPGSPGHR